MVKHTIALILALCTVTVQAQVSVLQKMVNAVSADSLIAYDRTLERAGGTYSRIAFTPGNDSSVQYILRSLKHYPDVASAALDTFYIADTAKAPYNRMPLFNVFGIIKGKKDPMRAVLVGAHLDSYAGKVPGYDTLWRTVRAPGADDNASGVSTVLELARIFGNASAYGFAPDYTIILAAFNAEESLWQLNAAYLYGSAHLAARLKAEGYTMAAVIAIDMTGYNTRLTADIVSNDASRAIGETSVALNDTYSLGLAMNASPFYYATFSDHASFWNVGYPGILIIEHAPPNVDASNYSANRLYHSPDDTSGSLNPELLKRSAQLALATAATYAQQAAATNVQTRSAVLPASSGLGQNFPNPFNPSTRIPFTVSVPGQVRIAVVDVLGREVALLLDEPMQPGTYSVDWNAKHIRSGCYFCRMTGGAAMDVKKLIITK